MGLLPFLLSYENTQDGGPSHEGEGHKVVSSHQEAERKEEAGPGAQGVFTSGPGRLPYKESKAKYRFFAPSHPLTPGVNDLETDCLTLRKLKLDRL